MFHTATNDHKIDAIRKNDKGPFCVIGQDPIVPEEYTTYFVCVRTVGSCHFQVQEGSKFRRIPKAG